MYAEPVNVIEEKTLKGTVNVISKCKVSMPRSFFFFFRISRRQEFPSLSQTSFFVSPPGVLCGRFSSSLFFIF